MQRIPMNAGEEGQLTEDPNKTAAQKDYDEGIKHIQNKDQALAANAFHNAMLGFEEEENHRGIAQCADKLGDICAERNDWDKAIGYYDQAHKICTDDFDRFSLFLLEKKKAEVIRNSGRLDDAIEAYLDVLDEYNGLNDPQGSVKTLDTIADMYLEIGKKKDAADAYKTIASIHVNFGHKILEKEYLEKAEKVVNS